MCGIAGIFHLDGAIVDQQQLLQMTRLIRHRGPDDEGFVLMQTQSRKTLACHHEESIPEIKEYTSPLLNDFKADLAFGFRRLSILDLSPRGHQPMSSAGGRYWMVFNGEVYNYLELRAELENKGFSFNTHSDTEVILAAYQAWGADCLNRFNGMWALAIWDVKERELFAARDRYGIKPFNYFFDGNTFRFGSEIKQLLGTLIDRSLNETMIYRSMKLNSFLMYGDETYFKQIKTLRPAHYLRIKNGTLKLTRYYDLDSRTFETFSKPFPQAVEAYSDLFKDAVRLRMRSDVEVGSCLSGGLDSSAIVGSAVEFTNKRFQTFSAFYNLGPQYDERKWMELVARKTGVNSHLVEPAAQDFWDAFEHMTFINDYPITGSSFISQYYVMKLARMQGVTVLLDGQGSDEITGGYNHTFYRYYADLLRHFHWLKFAREFPQYARYNPKGSTVAKLAKTLFAVLAKEPRIYREEAKHQLGDFLTIRPESEHYLQEIRHIPGSRLSNFLYNLIARTMIQTLLHFEDRNSMGFSIESRVPFLDNRLVEFAFTLPGSYKVHGNFGKYIHREALKQIVPQEIANRKDKVSFTSPGEALWLKNELRPHVEDVLQSVAFRQRGMFDLVTIDKAWQDYLNGNDKQSKVIWRAVALEKWFRVMLDGKE